MVWYAEEFSRFGTSAYDMPITFGRKDIRSALWLCNNTYALIVVPIAYASNVQWWVAETPDRRRQL